MSFVIVAQLTAKEGQAFALETALRALVAPTRAEDGCESYVLHASLEDLNLFHFHEIWRDKEAWLAHRETPHMKHFGEAHGGLLADRKIFQFEPIE